MSDANETLLQEAYGAVAERDADRLFGALSDDITFHVPGENAFSGAHRGKDGVMALLRRLDEVTDGTFDVELQRVVPGDEFCVALVLSVAEREGRTFEGRDVHVWRLAGDKLAELWIHPGDQYDADEFFGPPGATGAAGAAGPGGAARAGGGAGRRTPG